MRYHVLALIVVVIVISGCGRSPDESPSETEPVAPDTLSAVPESDEPSDGEQEGPPSAPWSAPELEPSAVAEEYVRQWRDAENRATCALIAPSSLSDEQRVEDAEVRAAHFAGGWAVAYDLPQLRSAFGVAGTGAQASDSTYDEWPHEMRWADGSIAEYGPEGGSGPNQLAYLRIEGQECLYNVWSRLGTGHLEHLLNHLRFVAVESNN